MADAKRLKAVKKHIGWDSGFLLPLMDVFKVRLRQFGLEDRLREVRRHCQFYQICTSTRNAVAHHTREHVGDKERILANLLNLYLLAIPDLFEVASVKRYEGYEIEDVFYYASERVEFDGVTSLSQLWPDSVARADVQFSFCVPGTRSRGEVYDVGALLKDLFEDYFYESFGTKQRAPGLKRLSNKRHEALKHYRSDQPLHACYTSFASPPASPDVIDLTADLSASLRLGGTPPSSPDAHGSSSGDASAPKGSEKSSEGAFAVPDSSEPEFKLKTQTEAAANVGQHRPSGWRAPDDQGVCRHFMRTGRCMYGSDCKFQHSMEGSVRRMTARVCWRYRDTGRCERGAACQFAHLTAEEIDDLTMGAPVKQQVDVRSSYDGLPASHSSSATRLPPARANSGPPEPSGSNGGHASSASGASSGQDFLRRFAQR